MITIGESCVRLCDILRSRECRAWCWFQFGQPLLSSLIGYTWPSGCGPLVTSKGLRGRKSFDTVVVGMDFRDFSLDYFHSSFVKREMCRKGGCEKCI